jgi:integrase/recombinase XerD
MAKAEKAFVGKFKETLEDFIRHKRNLGYKYEHTRENLLRFSEYTLNYAIDNNCLSKELVLKWTAKRKNETVKTWKNRVTCLRQYALYLQNQGQEVFIPQKIHKASRSEYIPYIFTHEQIDRLFQVVDSIAAHPRSTKHECYPLLFRLLYCCGLRVSEALNLKISDVDFDKGVLLISQSKFDRDRLVPMSPPLTSMFVRYRALFKGKNPAQDYCFGNKNGTRIKHDQVYKTFRKLLWKAGISHGGKGKGPRVHDFRHSFCVHTLAKQAKDGVDLYIALPILSTYVGHGSVGATQRYVRLTIEAYPDLMEKVSRTCSYVIPEVA